MNLKCFFGIHDWKKVTVLFGHDVSTYPKTAVTGERFNCRRCRAEKYGEKTYHTRSGDITEKINKQYQEDMMKP